MLHCEAVGWCGNCLGKCQTGTSAQASLLPSNCHTTDFSAQQIEQLTSAVETPFCACSHTRRIIATKPWHGPAVVQPLRPAGLSALHSFALISRPRGKPRSRSGCSCLFWLSGCQQRGVLVSITKQRSNPIPELSVVIPTLDASARLGPLLRAVGRQVGEVLVVDGISRDGPATAAFARASRARFITSARGRGQQIRAGCAAASGSWILILHVDSTLPPDWADEVRTFIAAHEHRFCAAAFRLAFDDQSWGARRTAVFANLRTRLFALPYGDQGLLISRLLYDEIGGMRALPIMEDVDMIQRIGRARLRRLRGTIRTSAERYRRDGWLRRNLRNLVCLALWFGGASAESIMKRYAGTHDAAGAR